MKKYAYLLVAVFLVLVTSCEKPPAKKVIPVDKVLIDFKNGEWEVEQFPIELNSKSKGSYSFGGHTKKTVSISYSYVGKVDLAMDYLITENSPKGDVIALRYLEYEDRSKPIVTVIKYVVYEGGNQSFEVGDFNVTVSSK